MKDILEQVKLFLKINEDIQLYAVTSEESEQEFNVFEKRTGELVACYEMDGKGGLKHFETCRDLEKVRCIGLSHEAVHEIAQSFLQVFASNIVKFIYSSEMIEEDYVFQFSYELRDERYGLTFPQPPVVLEIAKDGRIQYFFSEGADREVHYPAKLITKEEAREKYIEALQFELLFAQADKEIYENGDDSYHLVYAPKEHVMDIGANGELHTLEDYNGFVHQFYNIEKRTVQEEEVIKLIGLDDTYIKIHTNEIDEEVTELWTKRDYVDDVEVEEGTPFHTIQVRFHKETFQCISVINNERKDEMKEVITEEEARESALQFLFACYPKADEQFLIERSHPLHHCIWEDENCESQYGFWFHPLYKGKRVGTYSLVIQIGQQSGKILEFQAVTDVAEELHTLNAEPTLSEEAAKSIYVRDLEMELVWVKEQNPVRYELCYAPSFPKTDGHIRMIEAHTGMAFHVKVD
ncbi:hypothetical protein BAMA_02620 [Bacillus manliponensis]|uniref:YcdB/YcdC repeated domain-containing protein n=1 Tax=Bacillus manliponensis TaxID=574376 RepID=A0A073JXJ6_9BACI|nr:YcdB/YcdC domain-containing protein [Bacillus manliponensis]KEK18985.1 hypothetical protein BAMA_02620 [Bacillus manliponensis]